MLFGAKGITGRHQRGRQINNPKFLGYSTPSHEGLGYQFQMSLDTLAEHAIEVFNRQTITMAEVKAVQALLKEGLERKNYGKRIRQHE